MHKRDLLARILRPRGEGQDDLERSYDDGKSLKRDPDLDCLSVQRMDLSLCVEKSF